MDPVQALKNLQGMGFCLAACERALRVILILAGDRPLGRQAELGCKRLAQSREEPIDGADRKSIEVFKHLRKHGRVLFDTMRLAQTGQWSGWIQTGGHRFEVTPDSWWGTRDRSWGVRPVGEEEPTGIRTEGQMTGMWNYAPMQFDDHSILYILNEHVGGHRELEEAVRIWNDPDREPEWLGRPEHACVLTPGTRRVESSVLSFPEAPGGGIEIAVEPLMDCWLMHGTGYGIDPDWRHGMYQGPLVVQGRQMDYVADKASLFGLVDQVARFTQSGGVADGSVGHGLHEFFFIGDFPDYGLVGWDPAP